jgi:hypothetical protein
MLRQTEGHVLEVQFGRLIIIDTCMEQVEIEGVTSSIQSEGWQGSWKARHDE